jgi:hypothetical protein
MSKRDEAKGEAKGLVGRVEETVDRGATTAEEIHRAIAELPFGTLERLGVFEKSGGEVKRIHDQTVGAIYDLVRDVNHKLADFAADLVEQRDARPDA